MAERERKAKIEGEQQGRRRRGRWERGGTRRKSGVPLPPTRLLNAAGQIALTPEVAAEQMALLAARRPAGSLVSWQNARRPVAATGTTARFKEGGAVKKKMPESHSHMTPAEHKKAMAKMKDGGAVKPVLPKAPKPVAAQGGPVRPKLTKAQGAKASAKISHLARTEPTMPPKQRVAVAMNMAREGRLGARGGYTPKPKPKKAAGRARRG